MVGDRSATITVCFYSAIGRRLVGDHSAISRRQVAHQSATSHVMFKNEKVKIYLGSDQETAQSERNSHT